MHLPHEAELLRIFIGETDKHHGRLPYEVIVQTARKQKRRRRRASGGSGA